MAVKTVNWAELEWEEFAGGQRFAAAYGDISRRIGATKLGYAAWVVPAGKASVPYHYHLVNEELALVLGGAVRIRLDGAEHELSAGDLAALPPGADSAHQFLNRGDRPAHLLLASTMIPREVVEYPDSGKRLVAVGGLAAEQPALRLMTRDDHILSSDPRDEAAYFVGEPVDEPLGEAPAPAGERDPRIVSLEGVPWETFGEAPFGGERRRLSRVAGARLLGYSLYRIPPGRRSWPFHFHHANEEFFYVRFGYGQLRTIDGTRDLSPGDAFACPAGIEGAHSILNTGDGPLEYFALSTMIEPDVSEYPDSDKLYVMVGAPPGGDPARRVVDAVFRREDRADYLDGER